MIMSFEMITLSKHYPHQQVHLDWKKKYSNLLNPLYINWTQSLLYISIWLRMSSCSRWLCHSSPPTILGNTGWQNIYKSGTNSNPQSASMTPALTSLIASDEHTIRRGSEAPDSLVRNQKLDHSKCVTKINHQSFIFIAAGLPEAGLVRMGGNLLTSLASLW